MTEIEMLREQLAAAQKENDELRSLLGRKKHQDAYPDDLIDKFPKVREAVGRNPVHLSKNKYRLKESFTRQLSYVIRSTVFCHTAKESKRTESYVSVQDMDREEYALWLSTLEGVLTALENGCNSREVGRSKSDEQDIGREPA